MEVFKQLLAVPVFLSADPKLHSNNMANTLVEHVGPSQLRDKLCLICQSEIEPTEIVLQHLICGNGNHKDCLNEWLDSDNCACPHCRACLKADQPEACIHTRPAGNQSNDDEYDVWEQYRGDDEWNEYFTERDEYNQRSLEGLRPQPGFNAQQRFRYTMEAALRLFYEKLQTAKSIHRQAVRNAEIDRYNEIRKSEDNADIARYELMLHRFRGFCPHPIHESLHNMATRVYETQTERLVEMGLQERLAFDTSFTAEHAMHNQTLMPEVYFIMSTHEVNAGDATRRSNASQMRAIDRLRSARIEARREIVATLALARTQLNAEREAAADAHEWQDDPEDPNTIVLMERPDEYHAVWEQQA